MALLRTEYTMVNKMGDSYSSDTGEWTQVEAVFPSLLPLGQCEDL